MQNGDRKCRNRSGTATKKSPGCNCRSKEKPDFLLNLELINVQMQLPPSPSMIVSGKMSRHHARVKCLTPRKYANCSEYLFS